MTAPPRTRHWNRRWALIGLALWLGITVVLQSTGVSLLTAHLLAAGAAFVIVVAVRLVRARLTVARARG